MHGKIKGVALWNSIM